MSVVIRRAIESDAEAIRAINKSALGYDYPLEETIKRVKLLLARRTDRVFVAVDEESGTALGYAAAADYETTYSGSMKNLMALAVDVHAQGLGIGRMLLSAVEDWAREDGCEAVRLVSGENRVGAHAFYQHCGYSVRKIEKNFIKKLCD